VRVVLTLVVRDEEDILSENLDYHVRAGVDLVVVTDHRSRDATPDILERYRRKGVARVFREEARFNAQQHWQTAMARVAFTDHGADWVLLGDADEFWWPREGSLKEALARVPIEYGSVRGLQRNFVPLRGKGATFAERMVVRLAASAPINDPATPFRPVAKVAVRAGPDVVVGKGGGHQVFGIRGTALEAWHPVEVLHFPLRSREQCARKYEKTWTGWEQNLRGDLARAQQASEIDSVDTMWNRLALDDAAVQAGVADGSLVTDVRLRDSFRQSENVALSGDALDVAEDELAGSVFGEAELVRAQRWVDDLERRVNALEDRGTASRVRVR
jgi:Glycosyl transferase family 2